LARNNLSRFVILGLINAEPMSGYDIKKFVQETIADFWNESYGNLYPTLKKLVGEGLAEKAVEKQAGRPDRMIYHITDTGREALKVWLHEPFQLPRVRNEFLLKLFFGDNVSVAVNRRHVEAYRAQLQAQFIEYEKSAKHYGQVLTEKLEDQLGLLTLRQGTLVLEARLKWCEEALEVLSHYE